MTTLSGIPVALLMRALRPLNPAWTGGVAGAIARTIGPRLRGHRTARENVRIAYPDKSDAEVETILRGMWDNLGRTAAEYSCLDRLWDYRLDGAQERTQQESTQGEGRVTIDAATAERLRALSQSSGPGLFFAAHLANWELAALVVPAIGRESAMMYRPLPFKFAAVAGELAKIRERCMGTAIPADGYAVFRLSDAIQRGALVGMLADQQHLNGIGVTFFGRACRVNPTIARLARTFGCPIHGARVIRLPKGRFRYEMTSPIDPPRDERGRIDVARTMQLITDIIEGWVREHPEQWMWLHHRWR